VWCALLGSVVVVVLFVDFDSFSVQKDLQSMCLDWLVIIDGILVHQARVFVSDDGS
jgi:hypothetical protein